MSKAILVMDMPKCCIDCPCRCFFTNVCNLKHKDCKYNAKRQKWCPLKEVPEKKDLRGLTEDTNGLSLLYEDGYNACIDDVLGGTDNEENKII